jgi:hypothetical protein
MLLKAGRHRAKPRAPARDWLDASEIDARVALCNEIIAILPASINTLRNGS